MDTILYKRLEKFKHKYKLNDDNYQEFTERPNVNLNLNYLKVELLTLVTQENTITSVREYSTKKLWYLQKIFNYRLSLYFLSLISSLITMLVPLMNLHLAYQQEINPLRRYFWIPLNVFFFFSHKQFEILVVMSFLETTYQLLVDEPF